MELAKLLLDESSIYVYWFLKQQMSIRVHLHYIFLHLYMYSRNTRGIRKGIIVTNQERDGQSDPYVILCASSLRFICSSCYTGASAKVIHVSESR